VPADQCDAIQVLDISQQVDDFLAVSSHKFKYRRLSSSLSATMVEALSARYSCGCRDVSNYGFRLTSSSRTGSPLFCSLSANKSTISWLFPITNGNAVPSQLGLSAATVEALNI
jgi:hypothetical protein